MGDDGHADLVLRGGAVYTVDAARRRAEAVAVRDGRIVAVGTDAHVRELVGPRTEVVELRGRMLLPGFQDAHVHPAMGGLQLTRCDLSELDTIAGYTGHIAAYAAAHPDEKWILGGGWSMPAFPGGVPDRETLDAVTTGRPAYLPNRDGHSAWVNTRALELAGVTRETPDPPGGRIERDAAGDPSGALHESAMGLVGEILPESSPRQKRDALLAAQAYLHSLGITGWQDAAVGASVVGEDFLDTYLDLAESGELTARVVGALWWQRERGIEQLDGLLERRERAAKTRGRFRADTVKIMQDGVCETFTAAMLSPYLDAHGHDTANAGMSFVEPDALRAYVTRLDAEGFQVHLHALGDRAVREALDAVAAARKANGQNDSRHHLAHLQVIHPDDVPRFRQVGAVANCQALWACNDAQMTELTVPFLGPERTARQYPFGSLERAGAMLAMGSDWSVSSPNPFEQMHVAVNRLPADGSNADVLLPDERLPLSTALHAFTMGSAYVNHLDDITGSIEVGRCADLVVADHDLFAVPVTEIGTVRAVLTMVEGQVVHRAEDL
jgi:predicted amidohydrolase YtcJ